MSTYGLDWVRKPFLQQGNPTSAMVCWRLDRASKLTLRFGKTEARTDGLRQQADASQDGCLMVTHPPRGVPGKYSFWIIGDAGTGNAQQAAAKDSYLKYNNGPHSDGLLMLGDNAYDSGYDAQFTEKLFTVYRHSMRNTFTWPTIGNHENYSGGGGYLNAFYLPTEGQSGGVPSKTELYYSYDYGNIPFICLDSEKSSKLPGDPMLKWLEQDLQAARQDWIIAFFHHPPYTMGSHNSDSEQIHIDVRKYFLPVLERIVLDNGSGDPNKDGAYHKATVRGGLAGAIYTVAGSSGKVDPRIGDHPMMKVFLEKVGTVILRIEDNVADARMLDDSGRVLDHYQVVQPRFSDGSVRRARRVGEGSGPSFTRQGRELRFPGKAAADFALYSTDGKLLLEVQPTGVLTLDPGDVPDGEYYFRYGSTVGPMVVP